MPDLSGLSGAAGILPEIVLTGAIFVVLLLDLLLRQHAHRGAILLAAACLGLAAAGARHRRRARGSAAAVLRHARRRRLRPLRQGAGDRGRAGRRDPRGALARGAAQSVRRVPDPDPLPHPRHVPAGERAEPPHALPLAGTGLAAVVHPGRVPPRRPQVERGGPEVRDLRRRRLRPDALRLLAAVRPGGHARPARHRRDGGRPRVHRRRGRAAPGGDRRAAVGGRLRLQDRRGAVPHVVPRRLRGRADAVRGLPLGGPQGRGLRRAAALLPGRASASRPASPPRASSPGRWCSASWRWRP